MGLDQFFVILATSIAERQWTQLLEDFGDYLSGVTLVSVVEWQLRRMDRTLVGSYVCTMVCTPVEYTRVVNVIGDRFVGTVLCVVPTIGRMASLLGSSICGRPWIKSRVQHRCLGGLTRARIWLCHNGLSKVRFGLDSPPRGATKFLEPSCRLSWWASSPALVDGPVWDTSGSSVAPWPVSPQLHLYTYTVLFDRWIYRPLSDKEWAQFLDLRPEWGSCLRSGCSSWGAAGMVPLRFFVELGLSVAGCQPSTVPFFSESGSLDHAGRQLDPRVVYRMDPHKCRERVLYLGWHWESSDLSKVGSATTHDDAGVQYHLWAIGGSGDVFETARQRIRGGIWRWWICRVRRLCLSWLKERAVTHPNEEEADRKAICDCLRRLANSNWFEWTDGSRIHFWRWPERWLVEARDGAVPWIHGTPDRRFSFPTKPLDQWMVDADAEKIAKLIHRRYLEKGLVTVVIPRHIVPKGESDIRVVWDMTKNMVNGLIFASTFFLMGIYSLNLRMHAEQWVGDFDCGEMFNNFTLHVSSRSMFGVYLSDEVKSKVLAWLQTKDHHRRTEDQWSMDDLDTYMRWARLPFGWRPAPVFAVRMMMRAIELAKGAPEDLKSPFSFASVILNLPGSPRYDPALPRVFKLRADGLVACDVGVFVDDGRVTGPTESMAAEALRWVTAHIQWLGIQDAPRKRTAPTQTPRAYTGGVTHTDKGMLRKFLVEKKWKKMKAFIRAVIEADKELDRKEFESGVGFLTHCSSTYEFIRPYMVGFYLAMNKFRNDRDRDGWRLDGDLEDQEMGDEFERLDELRKIPEEFRPVGDQDHIPVPITDLLRRNAETLDRLLSGDSPLQVLVRPISGSGSVTYSGSDASGEGFGMRDWNVETGSGEFVYGYWNHETDGSSSNWREMKAALDKLRSDTASGRLAGQEVWFITDNSTLERAFYKGYSSSKELYVMVEEIRALSLRGNFLLRIVHVAGTRMIETGIDGLSRGELELGLLRRSLRDSIPLHLSPFERSPELETWIREWADVDGMKSQVATPMDWHYNAHQSRDVSLDSKPRTWIWDLAPGAALYALEELASARTKRLDMLRGIVVVPELLNPEWFRRFTKAVDVYFRVPAGSIPSWDKNMHESLTIGLYLPCFRERPWDWKNVEWMGDFGRSMSQVHKKIRVDDNGEELVEKGSEDDFLTARPGDSLVCPFECDFCSFERLTNRSSEDIGRNESALMVCIRRAKLDAFWARTRSTVSKTRLGFGHYVRTCDLFEMSCFPRGPVYDPQFDDGLRYAVVMLWKSLHKGRHGPKMKVSAIRSVRTVGTNVETMLNSMTQSRRTFVVGMKHEIESSLASDSEWLKRFLVGMKLRIGEVLRQDWALTPEIVVAVLSNCEKDWEGAIVSGDLGTARRVTEEALFFVFTYAGGMRSFEVVKITLTSLEQQICDEEEDDCPPHIGIPLMGRFKNREGEHVKMIIFLPQETKSGVKTGVWVKRMIECMRNQGIVSGWLFQDADGVQMGTERFRESFYERLEEVHHQQQELFPPGLDIREDCGPTRSGRRGANSRLLAQVKKGHLIDLFFRWNTGGDETSALPMRVLYAEKRHLVKPLIRVGQEL